ncbi:MAG: hypothetical protein H0U74_23190 [Bradymonadaceae bacterium]|nr:hypothetical protein [Lujinxingiaceae bacterium]
MNYRNERHASGGAKRAVALSVILHLVLAAVFMLVPKQPEDPAPPAPEAFEVAVVMEEEPLAEAVAEIKDEDEVAVVLEELVEPEELAVELPEEVIETPEEETPEEVAEEELVQPEEQDKAIVVQQTNEETPSEADYLSDQANKVDEETRAEETSMEEVAEPSEENANPMEDALQPVDPAEEDDMLADNVILETTAPEAPVAPGMIVEPQAELLEPVEAKEAIEKVEEGIGSKALVEEEQEAVAEREAVSKVKPKLDPRSLFNPDIKDYKEVFGGADNQLRDRERVDPNKRRLLKDWKEKEDVMRASLENFIHHVQPGNHTGVNAQAAVYASYLAGIHRRIHSRYVHDFIENASLNMPAMHPLNRQDLNTLIELVIDAKTGTIEQTNIVRSSGEMLFDAEIVMVARSLGKHPDPPQQIVSKDGRVYLHWNFWRDSRQCGTFGARLYLLND